MCPVSIGTSRTLKTAEVSTATLWLLLVGVNQYQDTAIPALRYSALDCQGLAEALSQVQLNFGQNVIKIYHDFTPELPDLATIRRGLAEIATNAQPQDTILFYFSGHGILDSQTQQAVLCLTDTKKDHLLASGLSIQELLSALSQCQVKQQLIWLDACHSGGLSLFSLSSPIPQLVKVLEQKARTSQGFYALLSCDQGQQSWEFPELGHGVFTYYLMRGLRGEAADTQGTLSMDGLYRYVYYQTLQYIDKTNQQLRLINQQKRGRGETQLQSEYPLQTPKRIVEGVGELILGDCRSTCGDRYPRQALMIDGLNSPQSPLALSQFLNQVGRFELTYWHKQKGEDIKSTLQQALQIPSKKGSTSILADSSIILLYLRGKISETETGDTELVCSEQTKISQSWLRQQLRRTIIPQQIVILDILGEETDTGLLQNWVEALQLESEQSQCIIGGISPSHHPDHFAKILLKTLQLSQSHSGLPVAGWITQIQLELAGTSIEPLVWLSGARGVIEVLPAQFEARGEKAKLFDLGLCPYRGLAAFTVDDALYFYGRESLTQQLVNHLSRHSFLAVVGASGSGKSSLVQAGLMAQLQEGKQLPGSSQWRVKVFRPGVHPLQALASCLEDSNANLSQVEGLLYLGVEGFVYRLRSLAEPVIVLVIDQFEEVFTLAPETERENFIQLLLGAVEYASDRFKLVITLRADFIATALELPQLAKPLQTASVLVPPQLSLESYREVIVQPAKRVGLSIEPELVEILLQELDNSTGDLPLLEFVLAQLWEHRRDNQLTLQAYLEEIGGLKGALERKAQTVYEELTPVEQDCFQWLLLTLIQVGEEGEATRRRVWKSDLLIPKYPSALIEQVIQVLVNAKLVIVQGGWEANFAQSRNEDAVEELMTSQPVTIEIAHEILIRHWSTLRWWLQENRTRLYVQRQLEQAANLWQQGNQRPEFLLQGVRLAQAEEIYIRYHEELPQLVQRFIEVCIVARERQQRELKRRLRQTQLTVGVMGILAIATSMLGWLSYQQKRVAQLQEITALNSSAEALLLSNQQLEALITSTQAARLVQALGNVPVGVQLQTASTLEQMVQSTQEWNRLTGHAQVVNAVSYSPDGQFIASGSDDQTVRLWDSEGRLLKIVTARGRVTSLSFSREGKQLAIATANGSIQLVDVGLSVSEPKNGHNQGNIASVTQKTHVSAITFSPKGQFLVSTFRDKTVSFWDNSLRLARNLETAESWVNTIDFNRDETRLASGGEQGIIQIWDNLGKQVNRWVAHSERITQIDFHPIQGNLLASSSGEGKVKIWDIQGKLLKTVEVGAEQVNTVQWSPDGELLATASDRDIQIWDNEGNLLQTFRGHGAEVKQISFSPNGETLVSASADKTVRIWRINLEPEREFTQQELPVYLGAMREDEQQLITSNWNQEINVWQRVDNTSNFESFANLEIPVSSPISSLSLHSHHFAAASEKEIYLWRDIRVSPPQKLTQHQDQITQINLSPTGEFLLSASLDKTAQLWQVSTGKPMQQFKGHQAPVTTAVFSPNQQFIATGGEDQQIKLWRIDGSLTQSWSAHNLAISALAFSPNSQILASGSWDNTLKLWSVNSNTPMKTLLGHAGGIKTLDWSQDGEILISGAADGKILIWTAQEGILLKQIIADSAAVNWVHLSRDRKTLLSIGENEGLKRWNLDLDVLLQQSCTHLQDYLHSSSQHQQLCPKL